MRSVGTARVGSALCALALLTGCGALTEGAGAGDGRDVVASFYPLAWVTQQVAGDAWTVSNLTTPGGEPHDLELSIEATAALAEADLVVYLEHFQPAVDDAVETTVEGATLEAGATVELRPASDHTGEDHHDEEQAHDHGELDPHFWLDPTRMAALAGAVAAELGRLDPEGAERYRAAAAEVTADLEALDREYAEGLRGCERDLVVVSHDAFGYLEKYGLHLEPITGLSPDAEPTPAALADLSDLIEDEGLTTVFSERLASPALAETLAADLEVSTAVLDPLEGLDDETSGEDYLSLMRDNLAALREANGC
ncbi:MAG TPA: zinc ABC transporter substrate-binding protein [Nocardioides sp.]|nr:zinc ABC transporter substrate-binding protein [Nocardioides sp.]